jgi:hypothetical protein
MVQNSIFSCRTSPYVKGLAAEIFSSSNSNSMLDLFPLQSYPVNINRNKVHFRGEFRKTDGISSKLGKSIGNSGGIF